MRTRKVLFLFFLSLAACGDACETTSDGSGGSTQDPSTSTGTPNPGASGRMKPKIDLHALTQPAASGAPEAGAPAASAVP